jgi:hypothetical protein|nr:MAG TPA: hypothetical protein [Caudoviricetes sp.]
MSNSIPEWAGESSKDFTPEIVVSPILKNKGLEGFSRKTPVSDTYTKPLSRTIKEPTRDEAMKNIMKKFHS